MSELDRSFLELNIYKIKNSKLFRLESGQVYTLGENNIFYNFNCEIKYKFK